MTAEIAILNRVAVALAADSALTISSRSNQRKERVWKTTNKLFSLSPENDIGIMIFGAGDFCGTPWETVIKLFIQSKNDSFDTIFDCVESFVDFLKNFDKTKSNYSYLNSHFLLDDLVQDCLRDQYLGANKLERRNAVKTSISATLSNMDIFDIFDDNLSKNDFITEFKHFIDESIDDESTIHVTMEIKKLIYDVCFEGLRRKVRSGFETGIVITGFGATQNLPHLTSFWVDGFSPFGLRYWLGNSAEVSVEQDAYIVPFGQSDISHLFMEGIEPDYIDFLRGTISDVLSKKSDDIISTYVSEDEQIVEKKLQKSRKFCHSKSSSR